MVPDPTARSASARPAGLPGAARRLVVSNALDASGRSASDVALDVLAVLALGLGTDQMGVLMALSGLGFLLFGVPIGILVDRRLSPRLLAAAGLAKAALLATLVAAWALDALTFVHLAGVMALLGVLTVLAETIQTTLVPRLVAPTSISRLIARLESADASLGLIVPAAAGLLVGALGAGPVLGVAAAFLAAGGLVALKVRMAPAAPSPASEPAEATAAVVLSRWARFWGDAAYGWTALRHTPLLWLLTLSSVAANIGMALFAPVEAVWVLTDLQLGPEFLGFQLTVGALGALAASSVAARAIEVVGEGGCVLIGSVGCALVVVLHLAVLVDRTYARPLLIAGVGLWGFMVVLGNIANAGIFARACPEGTLGRVSAMRRTLTRGSAPVATLLGGAAGAAWGVGWVLVGWQVLALLAFAFALAATRRLRRTL
ncbi:MFS transporter [Micrococcus sp.]|uniref:MFS transporter n=1 Tax=Micrococcus sp. TaxID=1271 RepID=UPI002A918B7E|nr:MFS transporter [Micrococcus sp.]MDY6055994.1 MFS transporter [Micrococcus sp.]